MGLVLVVIKLFVLISLILLRQYPPLTYYGLNLTFNIL